MNDPQQRIRIAIHVAVVPGVSGGTAQSTQGLISSLGQLEGPERYVLSVQTPQEAEWVTTFRGPNQDMVCRNSGPRWYPPDGTRYPTSVRGRIKAALRPWIDNAARSIGDRLTPSWPRVPLSDGYYESLGCDVLHFPTQTFMLCALPTVYNPHDLQHLHYPQFFTPWLLAWRETVYRAACNFSNTVVVGSEWIKQDIIGQYAVHPDKVQIIPWAPPTAQYPQIEAAQVEEIKRRLALPSAFALYPAVAWPHKNHLRLFDALAELRDHRGLVVNLVCTGARWEPHWPQLEQRLTALNLTSQVKFLGFLPETDLRALYRLAQFLILPSLFEADSCPIYEAWSEGLPVACSNDTALPDQVGDAGLLLNARNVTCIADALQKMATDDLLRRDLVDRGYRRVRDFDWTRTAKAYRAVYRRAAGVALSDEDRWLLGWDWMREPSKFPVSSLELSGK